VDRGDALDTTPDLRGITGNDNPAHIPDPQVARRIVAGDPDRLR
jgi:hypothetical protein